jgi:MinD-like ATPase involved in chromosome partitioning or flagellar assembly
VIVPAQRSLAGPPPATPARPRPAPVERALSGPGERRTAGWRGHVTVVPGGRGPGRPDHAKEARARAVLPLDRPRLVVVLGCTVGAGQTVTTLMLADLLAGLRGEPVAALDLNPGPASLTELARIPAITVSALLADRAPGAHAAHTAHRNPAAARNTPARGARTRGRLDVICQDAAPEGGAALPSLQHDRLIDVLASRYPLTLADPGAPAVAKLLAEAGQLVLVAPASPDAAQAVSMTCEWLAGHGHAALARHSIAVLNGVSQRSVRHAEQAELVLRGRCRAIVRVPWDDHLAEPEAERGIRDSLEAADGPPRLARLRPAVLQAYTALAGVLVSSLADDPVRRRAAR